MTLLVTSESAHRLHSLVLDAIMRNRGPSTVLRVIEPLPSVRSIDDVAASVDLAAVTSVVAFGGGSAIDSAKVLSVLKPSTQLAAASSLEDALLAQRQRELIAIPTTAGSGAEITPFASIWMDGGAYKVSIERPDLAPSRVILIPDLLGSCSTPLIRSSLLDAIGHCTDSLWNRVSDDTSEGLARRGLLIAAMVLPTVGRCATTVIAADLQEVSLLGGKAICRTRTSLAHALSYYFTSRHGLPHGDAVAMFIPAITRFLFKSAHPLGDDAQLCEIATAITAIDLFDQHSKALAEVRLEDAAQAAMASSRLRNFTVDVTHPTVMSIIQDALQGARRS
jgi:alcohol dehydrogenase